MASEVAVGGGVGGRRQPTNCYSSDGQQTKILGGGTKINTGGRGGNASNDMTDTNANPHRSDSDPNSAGHNSSTRTSSTMGCSTIRHAGRVHVRGMFRRIWRPRSLELHSDGILRYYEAAEEEDDLPPVARTMTTTGKAGPPSAVKSAAAASPASVAVRRDSCMTNDDDDDNDGDGNESVGTASVGTCGTAGTAGTGDTFGIGGVGNSSMRRDRRETGGTGGSWDHVPDAAAAATAAPAASAAGCSCDSPARLNKNRSRNDNRDEADERHDDDDDSVEGGLTPITSHYASSTPKSRNVTKGDGGSGRGGGNGGGRTRGDLLIGGGGLPLPQLGNDGSGNGVGVGGSRHCPTTADAGAAPSPRGPLDTPPSHSHPRPHSSPLPSHHVHKHRPKVTMLILHARTIDSSTLRDMHVGLPKGSFGFLFRGRPVAPVGTETGGMAGGGASFGMMAGMGMEATGGRSSSDGGANDADNAYRDASSASTAAENVYGIGSKHGIGSSSFQFASSHSATHHTALDLTQCKPKAAAAAALAVVGSADDNTTAAHPHRGAAGFNNGGINGDPLPPPRDYLCAVPTLEQAESWVVALQWAAGVARRTSAQLAARDEAAGRLLWDDEEEDVDDGDDDDGSNELLFQGGGGATMGSTTTTIPGSNRKKKKTRSRIGGRNKVLQSVRAAAPPSVDGGAVLVGRRKSVQAGGKHKQSESARRGGRRSSPGGGGGGTVVLVTKVKNYRLTVMHELLRLGMPRICLLYEIRTILLRNDLTDEGGGGSGSGSGRGSSGSSGSSSRKHSSTKSRRRDDGSSTPSNGNRAGGNSSVESAHPNVVEERTVYRSRDDVAVLLGRLREALLVPVRESADAATSTGGTRNDLVDDNGLRSLLQKAEDELHAFGLRLPSGTAATIATTVEKSASSSSSVEGNAAALPSPGSLTEFRSSYRDINDSVSRLDSIVRLMATNGQICNSALLREFLGLQQQQHQPQSDKGAGRAEFGSGSRLAATTSIDRINLPPGESSDEFVRRWLATAEGATRATDRLKLVLALVLQNNVAAPVLLASALSLVYRGAVEWRACVSETRVDVGVDALLLFGLAAFYGGYLVGMREGRIRVDSQERAYVGSMQLPKVRKAPSGAVKVPRDRALPTKRRDISVELTENVDEDDLVEGSIADDREDLEEDEGHRLLAADAVESTPYSVSNPIPFGDKASCWSKPDDRIFRVRGPSYLMDRVKVPSAKAPFPCRGVDVWLTDNPERHIARHPSVLGGKLGDEDTFVVNFLLPFGNFVSYFAINMDNFPPNVANVWNKFLKGDQQYRDARLKMLPVVVDGPWIVQKAVGPGTAPALLGKVIPLQYYFTSPTPDTKGVYEVDVIITASRIAKAILNVVKGHTKSLTIAFAFIIEAADEDELPETVLCAFQLHELDLENCQQLPSLVELADNDNTSESECFDNTFDF